MSMGFIFYAICFCAETKYTITTQKYQIIVAKRQQLWYTEIDTNSHNSTEVCLYGGQIFD